jgi:RimK family alpha-L-glutamate ligase
MTITSWVLNRISTDTEEHLIDRNNLSGEVVGGQYENIKIVDALRNMGVDVKLIRLKDFNIDTITEIPDLVFVRSTSYLDIPKLKVLESKGPVMLNPISCHVKCSNKWTHLELLSQAGIRIPTTDLITFSPEKGKKWDWQNGTMYQADLTSDDIPQSQSDNIKEIELSGKKLGWPLIIKPLWGTGGELVQLCHNVNDFINNAKKIMTRYNTPMVLAQEFINHKTKGVISAWMLGKEIYTAQLRTSKSDTDLFISNHSKDSFRITYDVTPELANLCRKTAEVLDAEITKMDILYDEKGYMICEVNAPGAFTGVDSVLGCDYGKIIAEYGIKRFYEKK